MEIRYLEHHSSTVGNSLALSNEDKYSATYRISTKDPGQPEFSSASWRTLRMPRKFEYKVSVHNGPCLWPLGSQCSFIPLGYDVHFQESGDLWNVFSMISTQNCTLDCCHDLARSRCSRNFLKSRYASKLGKLNGRSEHLSLEYCSKLQVFSFLLSDSYIHSH